MSEVDAVIIGAGMSGMYQLHSLRKLGLKAVLLEAGTEVGGTWYWNRYPGCRFDSESYSYCFSFDDEILQEWNWTEHFAPQTETFAYLKYVADKLDLRRDIRFSSRVKSAHWSDSKGKWHLTCEDGFEVDARYLITGIGVLSAPSMPKFKGMDTFAGRQFHTSDWPRDKFDLTGKRVAVIGTGATGVQVIQEVAKIAGQLTVVQKEPNWCKPLHNSAISAEEMASIKARYKEIFAQCKASDAAFLHNWDPRTTFDVTDEEREAFYEELYAQPGFAMWLSNFSDLPIDKRAAELVGDFLARKIRSRVKDPAVAEKLVPKDHVFGTRRVPMETGYFEVYNQSNVELIDVNEDPLVEIVPEGLRFADRTIPVDVIIYATGFEAIRGAFDHIDIRGRAGQTLLDKWSDGPLTFMGLQSHGFPNMFMLGGPHSGATFCNVPRCLEQAVEFVTPLIKYMEENGIDVCEATAEAEDDWTSAVLDMADQLLAGQTNSWFTGINHNLEGRTKRKMLLYTLGQQYYLQFCRDVIENDYRGYKMSRELSVA
ncbi:cation diffusion facilitator CzcD-associated flavoprotein CzcO [Novosphingobium kunmingense]|uniref:Cation diffusion facilitator CzcD-associated flavoprotein CzcO n=1 Tax=Novosphingobium kunmingense TaxID=1211806 RepID=A0A2N0H2Z8_9SPHN|nr:NAD(P)/FAD-dependent oxidoreductase [Novosphingobium kunmingense]PKB13289.1 cation diffusion facilitator CzcD-associated flavoprotein CzcO [Novosphingobium kunmingense]